MTRAILIGTIGLKQMVLANNVDYVEKEFNRFLAKTKDTFDEQSKQLDKKIDDIFNLDNKTSPLAQFSNKLDTTFDLSNTESPLFKIQQIILDYFDEDDGKFKCAIEEYFDKDNGQLKTLLDQSFDINNKESSFSKLIESIEEISGKDEKTIKELLDPHKTDSPAQQLKNEIFEKFKILKDEDIKEIGEKIRLLKETEIKDIRDALIKSEEREKERQKGTAKGRDFEELVYERLLELTNPYEDTVEYLGDTSGKFGKTGDIALNLDGNVKTKIIFECKDSGGYSSKKTQDEIKNAIDNRNASYGIFLFSCRENMPSSFDPIKITDSYLITYLDDDNLHYAYRLAKLFVTSNSGDGVKIELQKISKEVKNIEIEMGNIKNMQSQVSKILNAGEYLRKNLDNLHSNIDESILKIQRYFGDIEYSDEPGGISGSNRPDDINDDKNEDSSDFPDWAMERY